MSLSIFKECAQKRGQTHMLLGDNEITLLLNLYKASQPFLTPSKKGLEIGTLVGQTTYLLWQLNPQKSWVTLEKEPELVEMARYNFSQVEASQHIEVVGGDALGWLEQRDPLDFNNFDFVFIDANKGAYLAYWQQIKRLLPRKTLVVFDNIYLNLMLRDYAQATFKPQQKGFSALKELLPSLHLPSVYQAPIDESKDVAKPRWSGRVQAQMQDLISQLSQQSQVALLDQGDGLCVILLN